MTVGVDKKLSALDATTTLAGTELLECVQGGDNKQTTPSQILASQMQGDDTVWDDLDFAMTFRSNPSEDPPVWTQISNTGVYAWAFQNTDKAYFQRQILHAFKIGQTSWRPHVHWMPTTTATYTGTWTLTITGHVTSDTPSEAPLLTTVTRTGAFDLSATAWQGHLTPLNDGTPGKVIDGTGWTISTILFAKLELTLSAGAACVLSGFDLHGQIDTLGSREEYVK
jgi:hypothetical protein